MSSNTERILENHPANTVVQRARDLGAKGTGVTLIGSCKLIVEGMDLQH